MQNTLSRVIVFLALLAAAASGYMIGQSGERLAPLGGSTPAVASAQSGAGPADATPTAAAAQPARTQVPNASPAATTPVEPAPTPVPNSPAPVSKVVQSDALPTPTASPARPEFTGPFESLASEIPEVVGRPLGPARQDPGTGETVQRTTTGLMVVRAADSQVAFTNGARTWLIGPGGQLYERANGDRFEWEG